MRELSFVNDHLPARRMLHQSTNLSLKCQRKYRINNRIQHRSEKILIKFFKISNGGRGGGYLLTTSMDSLLKR